MPLTDTLVLVSEVCNVISLLALFYSFCEVSTCVHSMISLAM